MNLYFLGINLFAEIEAWIWSGYSERIYICFWQGPGDITSPGPILAKFLAWEFLDHVRNMNSGDNLYERILKLDFFFFFFSRVVQSATRQFSLTVLEMWWSWWEEHIGIAVWSFSQGKSQLFYPAFYLFSDGESLRVLVCHTLEKIMFYTDTVYQYIVEKKNYEPLLSSLKTLLKKVFWR